MKFLNILLVLLLVLFVNSGLRAEEVSAGPVLGEAAPNFTLNDLDGKPVELASFKDKYVVLEWTNYDCPFVKKHYSSGNMQALQDKAIADGVVWLTINSSAAGKQGNFTPEKWKELAAERKSAPTAILLDGDGKIGQLYVAKTTPEMFVIDPNGALIYMGAIDDKPTANIEDVKTAINYVQSALDEAKAGKPVSVPISKPYGCSVKY
ncbi:MAG: thioredoxin family protein [Candidatus Riflebacteria bacterium HGW-Riflebacteria-1]|jgi:peroxiredoxin|nr:MAG: thioredoxin family protein [Candidatus Riflebacteria bacterium HGW-Riflebacteria-1]